MPYHLCILKVPNAIAREVLFRDPVTRPLGGPVVEVCAVAKRDLKAGEVLDDYGMYMTYGEAVNADEMSAGRYLPEATLHEISKISGLAGKPEGVRWWRGRTLFSRKQDKEIADYCESDVVNTYRLWLRYELFRGRLNEGALEASERRLADFMNG